MENLIEELTKVNPSNLSEEGLKLFNKINEIIDRNEELEVTSKALDNIAYDQIPIAIKELEENISKEHTLGYSQGVYDCSEAWKETIKEKIAERKLWLSSNDISYKDDYVLEVLEEILKGETNE